MAITGITTVANPYIPSSPVTGAYAYAAGLGLDASTGQGQVTYNFHPMAADWTGKPLAQLSIQLGQVLVPADPTATPPVAAVTMPTLAELMQNSTFATAYNTIGQIIDGHAIKHPSFSGGSVTGAA